MKNLALLPLVLAATAASAQTLATYDFAGGSAAATGVASGITAGNFVLNFDGVANTDYSISSTTGNAFVRTGLNATGNGPHTAHLTSSQTDAFTGNDYFTFTLTPDSGNTIDYTSLAFNWGGTAGTTSPAAVGYTAHYALFTSADSFGTAVATGSHAVPNPSSSPSYGAQSISLSAFQDVATATEFRLYAWFVSNNGSAYKNNIVRLDDVVVSGAVSAIPEPSAFAALAGLGALGLAATRRGRRRA